MSSNPDTSRPDDVQVMRAQIPWLARRSGIEALRARSSYRNPMARDRARVLHCQSFRRLQGKFVFPGLDDGLLMRTRMTQTLETAQLTRGLVRALEGLHAQSLAWQPWIPDINLAEGLAFVSCLGEAPMGQLGAAALNQFAAKAGGFDPQWQTLRLLGQLEPYEAGHGLDLTRRFLFGVAGLGLHASRVDVVLDASPSSPSQACEGLAEWIHDPLLGMPEGQHAPDGVASWDASIVRLARQVARGVHELCDGIVLGRIQWEDWLRTAPDPAWAQALDMSDHEAVGRALFGRDEAQRRKVAGALVNALVVSVDVKDRGRDVHPLLRFEAGLLPEAQHWLSQLDGMVDRRLYHAPELLPIMRRAHDFLLALSEACWQRPADVLPQARDPRWNLLDEASRRRELADFLSGLTDFQVMRLHHQMLG